MISLSALLQVRQLVCIKWVGIKFALHSRIDQKSKFVGAFPNAALEKPNLKIEFGVVIFFIDNCVSLQ